MATLYGILIVLVLQLTYVQAIPGSECGKKCVGQLAQVCEYVLHLETYATMSKACGRCSRGFLRDCRSPDCVKADTYPRLIYTVNRTLPAPPIRVCENDVVIVNVTNDMNNGEGTSIHWHGMHLKDTPYMDGVSMITQCPILPLQNFTYKFFASPPGTHFYHAHVGMQRGEGIAGPLIVKPRSPRSRYQHVVDLDEHTIVVQDWYHATAGGKGILHLHGDKDQNNVPDSILINGEAHDHSSCAYAQRPDCIVFEVDPTRRYRFRVISNAVMNCPIMISLDDHKLEVISSDGHDIQPLEVESLVISGGERWDFIPYPMKSGLRSALIKFTGQADCAGVETTAILEYFDGTKTAAGSETDYKEKIVNPFNQGMVNIDPNDNYITLAEIRSLEDSPDWLSEKTNVQVAFLLMGLNKIPESPYNKRGYPCNPEQEDTYDHKCTVLAQINHVNGQLPATPYLSQYKEIPKDDFCDVDAINTAKCTAEFCQCIQRLKVDKDTVVELVLIDGGRYFDISNHPMHIHGQHVYIVGLGQSSAKQITKLEVEELHEKQLIPRNYVNSMMKDTIMMPDGGYVVVRFKASNPGPWLFHCHNELHVEQGMFMVIEVGEEEDWELNPNELYKCGTSPTRSVVWFVMVSLASLFIIDI